MFLDFLKAIVFGIVEGITEWLPVSSTGHLILLGDLLAFKTTSPNFFNVFDVVVQLGAVIAVLIIYWNRVWPFRKNGEVLGIMDKPKFDLWVKIAIACLPSVIVGLLFEDKINAVFYNSVTVAIMLILVGVAFIVIENKNKGKRPLVRSVNKISYQAALIIGLFQVIAAVFPGTSRSGATIVGALLIGISRTAAAEFTFFLAIPVMFGASLLKLFKYGLAFSFGEFFLLIVGMAVAFAVSLFFISFFVNYIKKHNFKIFGYYRILLGIIVLLVAAIRAIAA